MTSTRRRPWIPGRSSLGIALTAACAACAPFEIVTAEGNHLTYRHPFTETSAAQARKSAERLCGQVKQVPVKTGEVCSLTECTTHYQCMSKADAELYR